MGRLRRGRDRVRARREQLEARLADGRAWLERARARSQVVDTAVGVLRRERPVAAGILAAALAFRLFAMLIPLAYVLVAGIGFSGKAPARAGPVQEDRLGELVVDSIATVASTSDRGRWVALVLGGVTTLLAAGGVVEVLRWVHVLAWRVAPPRASGSTRLVLGLVAGVLLVGGVAVAAERARAAASGLGGELTVLLATTTVQLALLSVLWFALSRALPRPVVPWTALVPGALLFAGGCQGFSLALTLYFGPRAARASALYGSLGVALELLVSLFLFGRLAVAAAELNATLWERRVSGGG